METNKERQPETDKDKQKPNQRPITRGTDGPIKSYRA